LHSFLVALVRFRKQAAERMVTAFRAALAEIQSGHEALPFTFSYEEELVSLNQQAQTVADLRLEKRAVTLTFRIWNPRTWVLAHLDDYREATIYRATSQPEGAWPNLAFFVEFLGPAEDLLWFGNLVKYRLLQKKPLNIRAEEKGPREHILQGQGVSEAFVCGRPGLLTPEKDSVIVLSHATNRSGSLLFEPESLYRGALYGTALATIVLTNGSRISKLLQVSADRFKVHTYEVKPAGRLPGEQRVVHLQHLLPKGKSAEAERKLFLISEGSYAFLREIRRPCVRLTMVIFRS
jgi:hypothetical protein